MSSINVNDFLPTKDEIFSAVVSAGLAMAGVVAGGDPKKEALEQLGSAVAGRVAAGYLTMSDGGLAGVPEKDVLVGVSRGAYSLSKSRSNQRVATDALKGVVCSMAGKKLADGMTQP